MKAGIADADERCGNAACGRAGAIPFCPSRRVRCRQRI